MNMDVLDRVTMPDPRVSVTGAEVKLQGVTKSFGNHRVLRGIDLAIEPGQFVAIVGRSGCGKSTLLRLVAGLDTPTSGSIALDQRTTGWRDVVRLMFQESRLLPWQRVAANVAVGLTHAPDRQSQRDQAAAALREVGLAGRENAWPSVLSGGQKQRVALARALVSHPRLLLLDEPLGALDALTRLEMQQLLEKVWREQGFTAVLVTHDVGEAVALADRIILLAGGRASLVQAVDHPRPRRRGDAALAEIEGRILA